MRNRQLGMSPAKIAIAVAVTMDAIAGTGGMKKVTGTSSAVAMVAVRPGTAPPDRQYAADARITHSTYGSNTSANACERTVPLISEGPALEQTPGERHAQRLVERQMDRQHGNQSYGEREAPRHAQRAHPVRQHHESDDVKPDALGEQDIEHQAGEHCNNCRPRLRPVDSRGRHEPRSARARSRDYEHQAADAQTGGDQAGKQRRSELLARHRREPLDVPEDDRSERGQCRARTRAVDLFLASPTALSAAPRLASEAAMNFAVPPGSAH